LLLLLLLLLLNRRCTTRTITLTIPRRKLPLPSDDCGTNGRRCVRLCGANATIRVWREAAAIAVLGIIKDVADLGR